MGAAKRRGTFDERKAQAIQAGRVKSYSTFTRRPRRVSLGDQMEEMSLLIQSMSMIPLVASLRLRKRAKKRAGINQPPLASASYPCE